MSSAEVLVNTGMMSASNPRLAAGGLSKANEINLTRLVHLALNSSPKVGIVNFNVLKTFLLELLKALNMQNFEPKFGADDADTRSLLDEALLSEKQHDSLITSMLGGDGAETTAAPTAPVGKNVTSGEPLGSSAGGDLGKSGREGGNAAHLGAGKLPASGISIVTSDIRPLLSVERFHALEDKMGRFEQQIAALNSLPSNQQIIDRSRDLKKNASVGPILEVWQYTQMSKRLESNEEGITKVKNRRSNLYLYQIFLEFELM